MPGTAIQLFNDWLLDTNEHQLTGPNEMLNECVNQTYLLGKLLKGKGSAKVVRGGNSITERVQLDPSTQFSFYQPNETFSPAIEDTQSKLTVYWRFAHNMWAYTDHELELNEGDRLAQFKSLRNAKKQACKIETFNAMEAALWTTPSTTTMEASTGTRPYSIPAFITEDGLMYSGFSTLEGVSATTKTRWRNQVSSYAYATIDTSLIPAFDDMWRKVDFQSPPSMGEYIKDTKYSKFMILTHLDGIKKYSALTRDHNDRLTPANDLGWVNKGVTFNGIPLEYIKEMDNIGYTTGQPRFFWVNSEYLFPVFHSKRYFKSIEPLRSPNQPYTWVVHEDTWYNLFIHSRQRQGIVVPA